MCVTAAIAAVGTIASTTASIGAAKANAAQQKLALEMERKALQEQREVARLRGLEAEAERVAEYERLNAANRAAAAAMGTRESISFKALEDASREALAFDLRNIRMGILEQDIASRRGIRVNRMTQSAVGLSSRYQQIGAIGAGLGDLGRLGQGLRRTAPPKTKVTGSND